MTERLGPDGWPIRDDAGPEVDLTPRTVKAAPRKANPAGMIAIAVLLAALGWVLWNGLSGATVFFLNVDEAIERRDSTGDDRIRVQGTVVEDTVVNTDFGADFDITFAGAVASVSHEGDLAELFDSGEPVVVEGTWDGALFRSDRLLIKHGEVYSEENPDRIDYDPDAPPSQ